MQKKKIKWNYVIFYCLSILFLDNVSIYTAYAETKIPVAHVALDKSDLIMQIGEEYQLKTTIYPLNATNQNVTWMSSNEAIAKVDEQGNVVAVKEGNARITVISEDNGEQTSCLVQVLENVVHVEGVAMSRTELVLEVGEEDALNAIFTPLLPTIGGVEWTSSDETVVMVDAIGRLTALQEGNAVITVTTSDGGFQATCNVKVVKYIPPVLLQSVSVNQSEVEMYVGEVHTIYAITNPIDADNQNVSWKSSDESIASVSQNGVIEAYQQGTTVITVTTEEGNYTAQCKVTVRPILIRHIDIHPVKSLIQVSEKAQVLVNFAPSNATIQKFKWSSSNNQVAMVNDQGIVTGIAEGNVTIVATATDGSGMSASCEITVEESDSQPSTNKKFPDVGTKIRLSTGTYQVTKASNKAREVTFVKPKNSKKITLSIPPTITIDGYCYKVTAIANKACKGNKKLKSVKIGGNVKKIGKEAFLNCKRLRRIAIKSTVLKSVGKNSIKGIYKKAIITVPKERYSTYKKLLISKTGYKKTMKIKK